MLEYIKLSVIFTIGLIFGPLLSIYFSFYGDIPTLRVQYPILKSVHVDDHWELLFVFGLFWIGFFFLQWSWSLLKRIRNKPPKLEWWQTDIVYEIYVPTFCDSNGDGVGDLQGIIKKLDYLKNIGANTIWLSPIYLSGGKDGGYDVKSFVELDPVYGSMDDFDELVKKVHEHGMHILLDFIPNHTSDQHRWFQESIKDNDPNNPYRDYYIWYPSEDSVNPPTNWVNRIDALLNKFYCFKV